MKKHITTTNSIAAPATAVWAKIRTGENVDGWLPPITACRVEGNRRYCEAGDARLEETIESVNDETMTFVYSIQKQDMMPISDVEGTMRVEVVDADNCLLHWDVSWCNRAGSVRSNLANMVLPNSYKSGRVIRASL